MYEQFAKVNKFYFFLYLIKIFLCDLYLQRLPCIKTRVLKTYKTGSAGFIRF